MDDSDLSRDLPTVSENDDIFEGSDSIHPRHGTPHEFEVPKGSLDVSKSFLLAFSGGNSFENIIIL